MTHEELSTCDGRDGRKAYVAVNNKIYDVSTSALWEDGDHQGMHQAGNDLTQELATAPHVRAVIERFPVVGHLEEPEPPKKKGLFGFLKK
jgi:predicted heme/steroid binding protein